MRFDSDGIGGVAASACAGLAANREVPEVSVADFRSRADVLWVDARTAEAFALGRVPGAILLPADSWNERVGAVIEAWSPGMVVVVYCDAATCEASQAVARRLRDELVWPEVRVLRGGWQAWREDLR
jgi:rhodanese-related sulfurtransferase